MADERCGVTAALWAPHKGKREHKGWRGRLHCARCLRRPPGRCPVVSLGTHCQLLFSISPAFCCRVLGTTWLAWQIASGAVLAEASWPLFLVLQFRQGDLTAKCAFPQIRFQSWKRVSRVCLLAAVSGAALLAGRADN